MATNPLSRLKIALLTWVGAYTAITLIISILGPAIASWPLPLQTLLISVLMVIALSGFIVPTLTRVFGGWIASAPRRTPAAHRNPGLSSVTS